MTRALLLLVFVALGCSAHENDRIDVAGVEVASMAWHVDCGTTTLEELELRFDRETAAQPAVARGEFWEVRHPSPVMPRCEELGPLEDCVAFHRVWRRMMAARRELADCGTL